MEFDVYIEEQIQGDTLKEVRDKVQEKVDAFLEGTRGAKVSVDITPGYTDTPIAGPSRILFFDCKIRIQYSTTSKK